jgi:hypothetical protein
MVFDFMSCRGEIVLGGLVVCWNRQVTSHSLLVANPINRYLFIKSENPGALKETDWLPAAKGPFSVIMRLYWPKAEALEGKWTPPPVRRRIKWPVPPVLEFFRSPWEGSGGRVYTKHKAIL